MSVLIEGHAHEIARATATMECQPYLALGEKAPTRLARAVQLVLADKVQPCALAGCWGVQGQEGTYVVTPTGCDCHAAQFRHEWCYHRIAAALWDRWQARCTPAYVSQFHLQGEIPMPKAKEPVPVLTEDVFSIDRAENQPLNTDAPPDEERPVPGTDAGDIADPPVPMELIADTLAQPLAVDPNTLHGQAIIEINQALYAFSKHAANTLAAIDKSWDAALRVLNQNNMATLALKEALQSYAPCVPYSGTVSTLTPSGFPLSLTVQHVSRDGFLESLGGLLGWLKGQGFVPLTLPQMV